MQNESEVRATDADHFLRREKALRMARKEIKFPKTRIKLPKSHSANRR